MSTTVRLLHSVLLVSAESYLIFDGDCGFCTSSANWIRQRWPADSTARAIAWQELKPSVLEGANLNQSDVVSRAWWIADGLREGGSRAVARALINAGGAYSVLGQFCLIPPVSWLAATVYRVIAKYRCRLPGGTPACRL